MNIPITILIRYDEIGLKGRNRRFFESCLLSNIKLALAGVEPMHFHMPHGRILIDTDLSCAEECTSRLSRVPAVASFSVGRKVEADFDVMAAVGREMIEPHMVPGKELKFCVRAQRSDKLFPHTSPEINFEVGSRIMHDLSPRGLTVDLKNAKFILEIEVGMKGIYIFDNRKAGIRGLPVGCSGNVLCLLSGGIDSPVAAYMMMRRGCRVHAIFFDNRTFLGRGGYDKVVKLGGILNRFQMGMKLFIVPFQDIQVAIRDNCKDKNRVVLYRRMMYRIAQAVAERNKCLGLVTGESVGQVASQTLENLAAVNNVVRMTVLRPLIGMDKQEIIGNAMRIGTYETSIQPQPDCCSIFMPQRPATRSRITDLEADEMAYPMETLGMQAIENMEVIEMGSLAVRECAGSSGPRPMSSPDL
ncbi:MAG: tRNA 4-thiouridine(8) synthase ThiI [Nitrospinae bacterium CG11_big_fil_rev_8_21_14_0_20_56_8]|nr:MAG: tRNA 4-thiouridine(8) synthase ThiI [Nitrospinae bacterium CG11_big_fil_rev_8_21_14_0_20_56_8]